jgi:hypothetical protein
MMRNPPPLLIICRNREHHHDRGCHSPASNQKTDEIAEIEEARSACLLSEVNIG